MPGPLSLTVTPQRSPLGATRTRTLPPAGEWELSLKFDDPVKDKEIRDRFKNEEIDDILLVITYGGRTLLLP